MTATDLLSYLCAALAAMGNALANVMQRKSSLEQPADERFGLRLLGQLVRSRTWQIGFAGMVGSFVLQAVALGFGQLAAVEPIITLEVPLTLLVASRVFGARLRHTEWSGIFLMTFGMIALVALLGPQPGDETDVGSAIYAAAGGATAATILALIVMSLRGRIVWRTACLGAAAGTSFGLTATFIKETISRADTDGIVGIFLTWQTYVAVGFGIGGLVLMQWALHVGPLLAAQPGFTLLDPMVSILWGVLVFDETTRTGLWLVPATLGAVLVGVGVVVLAHSPLLEKLNEAADDPARPAETTDPDRSGGSVDEIAADAVGPTPTTA